MPRKKIVYDANLTYHVVSRCLELKKLFKSDMVKILLERSIRRAQNKYIFKFCDYIIMDTHVHFYIRTVENGEPISRIIQYIKSRFAEAYNRKMNRTGPFWNERYKCTITEYTGNPVCCYLNTVNYIGYNAVKGRLAKDPRDYKFCAFRVYVDISYKPRLNIALHPFYLLLGKSIEERIQNFLVYEKKYKCNIGVRPPQYREKNDIL